MTIRIYPEIVLKPFLSQPAPAGSQPPMSNCCWSPGCVLFPLALSFFPPPPTLSGPGLPA